jgi:hypothetical protein
VDISAANWNIVVVGRWNRGILTPAGIGQRLFGLPPGTPINVEISLDYLYPCRVRHDGLAVSVEETRLVIEPDSCTFPEMQHALEIATKAIQNLPETPLSAVGVNFRYKISDPPTIFLQQLQPDLDDAYSDCGYEILQRTIRRQLKFSTGHLNVDVAEGNDNVWTMTLNFEKKTEKRDEINTWLSTSSAFFEEEVKKIITTVFKLEIEE